MCDDIGELTPEDQSALEILNAEIAAPRKGRYRQTYQRRYTDLCKAWERRVYAYAEMFCHTNAIAHQRRLDIEAGETDFPSVPDSTLIDWYRRTYVRNHKHAARAALDNLFRSRGIDDDERRRMKDRNRKLNKSAETYRSGEDRSRLYNTERKLMSPEEMKAHDNAKAAQRMRNMRQRRKIAKESLIV